MGHKETVKQILKTEENHSPARWNGQVIVVGNCLSTRARIVDLIADAGGRVTEPFPLDFHPANFEKRLNAIAVVIHISDWDKVTQSSLSNVEDYCAQFDLPMFILLPLSLLDSTFGMINHPNTELLFTDEGDLFPAELLVSLNSKIVETLSATFSNRDEPNLVDLRKISADVERIARTLAQLSEQATGGRDQRKIRNPFLEPRSSPTVSDEPFGFTTEAGIAAIPYGNTSEKYQTDETVSANQIRNLIKARRLRDQYFDPELFADPAWDMLLDLMAARLENTKVSVSSLCIAASVPPTTALRWIKTMTEEKIFQRQADERDGRRIFIELSDNAAVGMEKFFSMVQCSNLLMI
ncbi:MAG: hypothetical protein Pars2KO_25150 [Parasphingorhabdus sp.]